jgi:hypothetical protein
MLFEITRNFAILEKLLVYNLSKNIMNDSYDREKVIEHMLDPITSTIIAELEDGEKNSLHLAEKSSVSETEVCERLSYLVDHGFIIEKKLEDNSIFSANLDKLSQIIENGENFGAAIEGLEKMDSFLN